MMFYGLKIKFVYFFVNKVYAGTKTKNFEKKRKLLNTIGHSIGEGTCIVGPLFCTGQLIVGKNCWLGKNLLVNGNGIVRIGDNCDIAPEVAFQTGGHMIGSHERRAGDGFTEDIMIGDGCWIGTRSTILSGVTISDGCVIAACACVNKNVQADTMVGGVPAREIRRLCDD